MKDNNKLIEELEIRLIEIKAEYENNVTNIENTINILKSGSSSLPAYKPSQEQKVNSDKNLAKEVSRRKSLKENILSVIANSECFMRNIEITKVLMPFYPNKQAKPFLRQMSNLLWILKKENKLVSYQDGSSRKDTIWGFPIWLNKDQVIKEERMPKYEKD